MSSILKYLCLAAIALLFAACANPGSGPDGGPFDETPPHIVGMYPNLGDTTGIGRKRRVTLHFSENIKVDNPTEKITISPPQMDAPEIKVSGKRITVELSDTLRPATTYTIDFSDAITDATEGNPLGNFTYYFSTGGGVDTMEVVGHVLAAENLEPVKGILVGLHADLSDSAFAAKPLERVARTDAKGHFSIKGVRPGTYRIYALKDMDGNFQWNRGEMLAMGRDLITPSCFADIGRDTAWIDSVRYDTIRTFPYTHFLPDDVVLYAFEETNRKRALLKITRDVPDHFTAFFTAPNDAPPTVKAVGFEDKSPFLEERNPTCDTITYWIADKEAAASDSLTIHLQYLCTDDSTGLDILRTDTLELRPRLTNERLRKQQADEDKQWAKQLERRHKRGDYTQEVRPVEPLKLKDSGGNITPMQNINFEAEEAIVRLDTMGFQLLLRQDSLEFAAPFQVRQRDLRHFTLYAEWRPAQRYVLKIDSASVEGLSGKVNKPFRREFGVMKSEEMGSLFVELQRSDTGHIVVELLQSDTKVMGRASVKDRHADFYYVRPGKYFLRLFYDVNGNGRWDTGDYQNGLQPERVVYCPQQINVRANWDTEHTWDLAAADPLHQKPSAITKTKGTNAARTTGKAKNEERLKKLGRQPSP